MAWCPIDSSLLLSSAKDYRTVCWDTSSGEVLEDPCLSSRDFFLECYLNSDIYCRLFVSFLSVVTGILMFNGLHV